MDGTFIKPYVHSATRMLGIVAVAFALLLTVLPIAIAQAETRSLKLYFLHTGERAEITFKKNGKYVDGGLKKINRFLRDWRRNEPTKMDPRLLDLIWEVYQETGSKKPIHVISAYRSPATNSLLRKRGRGVATKSQHTLGKALDFFIPGVSLAKLRNIGLKKGIGGVGYYPKSGSPFVHMDTGNVRHWPRMSRSELVRVFPDGKTLHVPTDGKPLARYNQAKAEYERKMRGAGKIVVAKAEDIEKKPGFFAKLLGRGDDDDEDTSGASAGTPVPVRTTTTPAPVPVPAAPVAEPSAPSAQTILASLPAASVPVPALAPRISAAPAALDTPAPADATIETETPLNEENLADDTTIAIASVIPQRRPSFEAQPVLAANPVDAGTPAPVDVAALTPQPAPQQAADTSIDAGGATDVFSANEIEDLRKQVYATIRAERQNIAPNLTPPAPVGEPQIALASARPTPVPSTIPQPETRLGLVENTAPATSTSEQVINTFLDKPRPIEPGIAASGDVPVPVASELKSDPATLQTASLEPLEAGGVVTTGEAIPLPNPNRADEPESPVAGTSSLVTAGVAVPSPANRPALRLPVQTAAAAAVAPNTQTKPQLERLETADLEEKLVGKWALAADTSISRIAEINPPAYGLNALRELPDTVLSSGFSPQNIKNIEQGFTGSSIEFLDFTRFN